MKTNIFAPFWTILFLLCLTAVPLSAVQFGLFTYKVVDGAVTITDYPEHAVGEVEIPAEIDGIPVTSIGNFAFFGCRRLTSVTIPASVTSIGYKAFYGCSGLTKAVFLGDASRRGPQVFERTAPGFTIYYLSSAAGFTSPTWYTGWDTYQATAIDSLPVFDDSKLSISYLATIPGITLTPETSTDLLNWTTEGVILSEIGADNRRTASVSMDTPERYLRLSISEE